MSFWGRCNGGWLVALALIWAGGCLPPDSSPQDEEKEAYFMLGRSRVQALDYDGAVEAFNKSLKVNPDSAAAHYELACLFDGKRPDPSAAIYHYREYLRLNSKTDKADNIRQRIESCKQQLAADVIALPSTPAAQKQIEALQKQLEDEYAKYRQLLDEVNRWRGYYAAQQQAQAQVQTQSNAVSYSGGGSRAPDDVTGDPAGTASRMATGSVAPANSGRTTGGASAVKPRVHVVASGETLAGIARKSGVSLAALQAANPGVTPKKLRVGQTLRLP